MGERPDGDSGPSSVVYDVPVEGDVCVWPVDWRDGDVTGYDVFVGGEVSKQGT